jgi:hypothetical protein
MRRWWKALVDRMRNDTHVIVRTIPTLVVVLSAIIRTEASATVSLYVEGAGVGNGEIRTFHYTGPALEIKSSHRVRFGARPDYIAMSPDERLIAAVLPGNRLRIESLAAPQVLATNALSRIPQSGSMIVEAIAWSGPTTAVVYLRDPKGKLDDFIVKLEVRRGTVSATRHPVDARYGLALAEYKKHSDYAYKALEDSGAVLLGHHRALPYSSREVFGFWKGSGIGSVEGTGRYSVIRDLMSNDLLSYRSGLRPFRVKRKSQQPIVQIRALNTVFLIQTTDNRVEVWDSLRLRFVKSIPSTLIVD